MFTFSALHEICHVYTCEGSCDDEWAKTVYDQALDLKKLELRLGFMKKCRNAGVVPKSLGNDRRLLLSRISEMQRQYDMDKALISRTFTEYGFSQADMEKFDKVVCSLGEGGLSNVARSLDSRLYDLTQGARDAAGFLAKNSYCYPIYNFSTLHLAHDLVQFMQKFEPRSNIFAFRPDELKTMAEIDSLAAELDDLYVEEGVTIQDENKVWRELRKSVYTFNDAANRQYASKESAYIRTMAKKLRDFCNSKNLVALSPDKGKGWVLVEKKFVDKRLEEFIRENFVEVKTKTESDEQYLSYREGRVRRALTRLRDTKGARDKIDFPDTITDREYRDANSQASRLGHHIPLAKIHKFPWLLERHGDGKPLTQHHADISQYPHDAPSNEQIAPEFIGRRLKFRFINPLKNSPSAPLGRLIGTILKPIQNSGLRTESIAEYAKNIQSDLRENPLQPDEEYTSWDVKAFYDNLDADLFIYCLGILWADFLEKSTRNLDFQSIAHAIRICYEDCVKFNDNFFKMKSGGPTGHAITSCGQNIVMSAFEKLKVRKMLENGTLKFYDRWVDDTFVRNRVSDRDHIAAEFHDFHRNIKFTVETAQEIERAGETLKFIPVLDIGVVWNPETGAGFTEVYRKPTTSEIVMPWNDFGPTDWKTGTLIGFIKRAYTHSSDFQIMHTEINRLKSQFRKVGYPLWLIHDKINKTLAKILYKANPAHYPNPDPGKDPDELPTKWSVLYLPWAGVPASAIVNKIRKMLPRQLSRISIAYTTSKIRDLLPRYSTCNPPTNKALSVSDVVYKYTCECGQVYIGETMRRLAVRISEHAKPKTPMMQHITNCEGSEFSSKNFSIVARGLRGRESRKRYESIWIRYYDRKSRAFNLCESSRDLKIF